MWELGCTTTSCPSYKCSGASVFLSYRRNLLTAEVFLLATTHFFLLLTPLPTPHICTQFTFNSTWVQSGMHEKKILKLCEMQSHSSFEFKSFWEINAFLNPVGAFTILSFQSCKCILEKNLSYSSSCPFMRGFPSFVLELLKLLLICKPIAGHGTY